MPLACATHLLTSLLYFAPVVLFVGWLAIVTIRDRRSAADARPRRDVARSNP